MENTKLGRFEESEKIYQNNKDIQKRAPVVETSISKSKDGKWIIHRTIITDIKPVTYFEQVLKSTHRE